MPEGEIDGVRERPVPEHNKSAQCAVGLSRRRCERTHSDTARGYTQFSMLWYVDTSMDPQDIYECVFLVATPDYEYGGRRIVGNTRLIRNGKPVASVRAAPPLARRPRQLHRRRRCPSWRLAAEFHEPLSRIPISLANQFEVVHGLT
jgi:hypothetical protein